MTAGEAIALAERHGVRLMLNGDAVAIEADTAPPADVVAALKAMKGPILGELRLRQALDSQRRAEVERLAVVRWINAHFVSSPPGICIHCGGDIRAGPFDRIFVGSDRGDVHSSCHRAWRDAREAVARKALNFEAREGN
jgi:hypothetical protein